MSRKKVLIILACLVILSFCFFVFKKVNFKISQPWANKSNQSVVSPSSDNSKAVKQSENNLTPEQIKQNQAALSENIKQGDLSKCESLTGSFKNVCEYNIISNQATIKNDQTICNQLTQVNEQESCRKSVAANAKQVGATAIISDQPKPASVKTQDEQAKEAILNSSTYKNLMALYDPKTFKIPEQEFGEFVKVLAYMNQPVLCQELPQYWRQECLERYYLIQAKKADDLTICDKISTAAWKDECYYRVISDRAVIKQSAAICDQLKIVTARDKCKAQVSPIR